MEDTTRLQQRIWRHMSHHGRRLGSMETMDGRHNMTAAEDVTSYIAHCSLHQPGYDYYYFLITRGYSSFASTSIKTTSATDRPLHQEHIPCNRLFILVASSGVLY